MTAGTKHDDVAHKMLFRLTRPPAAAALALSFCTAPDARSATAEAAADPSSTWMSVLEMIATTYDRAPALVLGLAVLFALPPLALLGAALRRKPPTAEHADATRIYRRSDRGRPNATELEAGSAPLWPSDAWIQVDGGERRNVGGSILRIGRDADNDICLDDKTVHRYHAAIHRTDEAAYVVTDLSSTDGNGILVNGRRIQEAQLSDGDIIELGQTKLTFASRPA